MPSTTTQFVGYLRTPGDLAFNAADIYPVTDTAFVLQSTATDGKITFGYPEGVTAATGTPLSAAGTLLVSAANIVQDGQIHVPFGSVILGVAGGSGTINTALGGPAATGSHFPTDIAAGTALGLATGAASHVALHSRRLPGRDAGQASDPGV